MDFDRCFEGQRPDGMLQVGWLQCDGLRLHAHFRGQVGMPQSSSGGLLKSEAYKVGGLDPKGMQYTLPWNASRIQIQYFIESADCMLGEAAPW